MGMNNIDFNTFRDNPANLKGSTKAPTHAPNQGDVRQFQEMVDNMPKQEIQQRQDKAGEMFGNRPTEGLPSNRPTGEPSTKQARPSSEEFNLVSLNKQEQPVKQELTSIGDLFNMQGAPQAQAMMEVAQIAPAEATMPPMEPEAMEALVSRILVGSTQSGDTEVKLMLNDNVLRNTEISVIRDLNGNLTVKILCQDPSSFQTLVASRQNLQEALNSKEKGLVAIDLRNSENNEGNDTNQRSRGLDALEEQAAANV